MYKAIVILYFILPLIGIGQIKSIGTPNILNYPRAVYGAGTQNWDISQDKNGFIYFANNDGILRFDGFHWELLDANIPLPVRSVYVDSSDRIYVGLIDNFGILKENCGGKYEFQSLLDLVEESVEFSDVWRIHDIKQGIVFQSFEKLFIYDGENIKVFSPKEKYNFSFNINGQLFIQENEHGLYRYLNGSFEKLAWADPFNNNEILSILELSGNNWLIGTANGFYKFENGKLAEWKSEVNDFIKTNKLFCSTTILENYLAFGTILNGLVISDSSGNIVQHLNSDKGLQNNTVLCIYSDVDKNLWLGLDNGIDYVEINSPISFISVGGNIGTGYCCIIHNNNLYLGTNQGLFVKPFKSFSKNDESFKLIENTEGQVWTLEVQKGELICGHNFGTFIIQDEKAKKISDEPGGWKYILPKKNPNVLIGGCYKGLALFKYGPNGWYFYKKLKGFDESSRFLIEDKNGFLWVSHGSKGIFKITLNDKLDSITVYKLYDKNSGLPSNQQNIVFLFKGMGIISTIDGIYEYDFNENIFKKSIEINNLFGNTGRLKTLKTDEQGNLWFIGEKESGVLRLNEDLTYTKISTPFKSLTGKFVNEFEFIFPYNNEHTFFAIEDGFAHYSSKFSKSYAENFKAFITKVEINNLDSIVIPLKIENEQTFEFPFKRNSFRFHYTSPFYENLFDLEFSYFLENYSEEWSAWSIENYKDFTNLHEDEYIFKIKAKNIYGNESEISSFEFTVAPPWHRSLLAYILYLFLFLALSFLLVRFILYRIKISNQKEKISLEKELQRKKEQYKIQAVIAEKEIIKLRNEKLREEKIFRDKELANQTMGIIQKNKFLKKLNEELRLLQNSTDDATVRNKITVLKRKITKESESDRQNKIFETYFDEVHDDFFNRLKEKYPQLSPNDLRLCAYIKMNISTKEISALLNISYRGVEISRYRLRKKMELSREINLSSFLLNI